jgi:hypothetical protein
VPSEAGYGLTFFRENRWNSGRYRPSIDDACGARGTRRSLRLDVERGQFYFYVASDDRRRFIEAARGANRMSFYLKLPPGWGAAAGRYYNLNVGTYLRDRRVFHGEPESGNNHHYFQIFATPDGGWLHVVLGESPSHQRDVYGLDPAKTSWRPGIARFYDALTRFYVCGVPDRKKGVPFEPAGGPYTAWFDELSFFYEDERVVAFPEYSARAGAPGDEVVHRIRVTNTHPGEPRRFAYEVTSAANDAWPVRPVLRDLEGRAVSSTPLLGPGESDTVLLIERVPRPARGAAPVRPHRTSVLAYQVEPPPAPADPRVENRSIFAERGPETTPAAGTLCVTSVEPAAGGAAAAGGPVPISSPGAVAGLSARADAPSRVELRFEAPQPQAFAYDVRIALAPIVTEADFERAMPLPGAPTPGAPGAAETMLVSGLEPGRTYSLAIRAEDAAGRRSPIAAASVATPLPR